MITGNKELDNIMEIAEAVFACPEAGKYTKSVEEAKYEAIQKALKTTQYYREHGFMSELVHAVFTKKMEMIKNANTVKDLKEIEKGSLPHFNGNNAEQPITALLIIIPNAFQNVNLAPAKTGRGRRSFGILRQREIEDLHSRRQGLRR